MYSLDYMCNTLGQATEVGVSVAGGTRQKLLGGYPFGPSAGWPYTTDSIAWRAWPAQRAATMQRVTPPPSTTPPASSPTMRPGA